MKVHLSLFDFSLCTFLCAIAVRGFQPSSCLLCCKNVAQTSPRPYCAVQGVMPRFASANEDDIASYEKEEILLQMYLSVKEGQSLENAKERVSRYCQSFPFAAVLPVQPLQYLPTQDGGVDVRFMRKKTEEKGSLDGGIRFFVSEERDGIEIVARRNSQGQTVPKIFSEKLVVQTFVKRIGGEEIEKTSPPPTDAVAVESIFHKWLSSE